MRFQVCSQVLKDWTYSSIYFEHIYLKMRLAVIAAHILVEGSQGLGWALAE